MARTLDDLEAEFRGVVRGEREPSPRPNPRVPNPVDVLTPANRELLQIIAERKPATVQELAELAGRQRPNVSRSLRDLNLIGAVRLVRDGKSIRPEVTAGELRMNLRTGETKLVQLDPAAE
jgi:predicted transcriptional regulator